MVIGVAGYINPSEFKEFLTCETELPVDNIMQTAVVTLVKEFLRQGHHVIVFSSRSNMVGKWHYIGQQLEIHMVGDVRPVKFTSLFKELYMTSRIKKLIETQIDRLDVIHAHWTYFYALAAKAFARKVPVFCTVRDWCPYIYSTRKGVEANLRWWINLQIFKRVMNDDKIHLIANSEYTQNHIQKAYPNKTVTRIYNALSKEWMLQEKINNIQTPTFITISQAIDDPRKNIISLVKAFEMYQKDEPNAKLILVGIYRSGSTIVSYIKEHNIKNVLLTGPILHDEVIKMIDESTCMVHPAYEETFGNILVEAMARRVPCIGGKESGGVPIVLGYGKNGLLCDISNPDDIYKMMHKLDDPDITESIVNRGTEALLANFSSDVVAREHISLFESILQKHK